MTSLSKFLLFAFITIVLVLGGLWIVGGKERSYSAQIVINAPADAIFTHLSQPELRSKWVEGLKQSRLQSNPPIQLESQFRSTFELDGSSFEADETIIRFDPGEMLVIRSNMPYARVSFVVRLEESGDATRLSYSVNEYLHGMARFQAVIAKSKTQERLDREVLALKNLVESSQSMGIMDQIPDEPDPPEKDAEGASQQSDNRGGQ